MDKTNLIQNFFKKYPMIKKSSFADYCGINPSLMRSYASGKRYISKDQLLKIEFGIKKLSNELLTIKLKTKQ